LKIRYKEPNRANTENFHELKRVQSLTGCRVVVRYVGNLAVQGLHRYSRFEWVAGRADGSTDEIDAADVVISEGTMMYLAVARGRPTIGINQHLPARANKNCDCYTPYHLELYRPGLAYLINFGYVELMKLIDQAIHGEQAE